LSSNKHIVFFTPGFPEDENDSLCIPAMQIFLKEFLQRFEGHISIITFQYPFRSKKYSWKGIDIYALGGHNKKLRKPLVYRRARRRFKMLHQAWPVTHLHSFWLGECAWIGSQIAHQYMLPHSCTAMGQEVLSGNRYLKKIRSPVQIITLSQFHADQLRKNYNVHSSIIPWGVGSKHAHQEKTIDLISVGSLIALKNVDDFVTIVGKLKNIFPDIICKVVGDGPLIDSLSLRIRQERLERQIELLGAKAYDETQELMARSRILIHLSDFESFGMVIIEALQHQTRVIAKPVGIANEIDSVVKIASISEAAERVKELLVLSDLPPSEVYPVESTVEQYLQIIS
jgi:glycosyltransferase involved in cell wall biosynthesis